MESPNGPAWRRYNGDGYGEEADGTPYDGAGVGRAWPLLIGERGHYELAAGRDPTAYLEALERFANAGGMLPEQVWDADDIPERGLFRGVGTGSATPPAWAHAEYLRLLQSVHERTCSGRWPPAPGYTPLSPRPGPSVGAGPCILRSSGRMPGGGRGGTSWWRWSEGQAGTSPDESAPVMVG